MVDSLASNYGLVAALAGTSAFIITSCYYYYRNVYSYWHERGVKGPRPFFIGGNLIALLFTNKLAHERAWVRAHGKVFGIYEGVKPVLVVADAEVMRQICIKDFDTFVNHDQLSFLNKYQLGFLTALRDERWRRIRAIMSPTFTSGKIKRMFRLLDACADDLVLLFREQLSAADTSKVANVKELYGMYTMDAIATCCYGLKLARTGSTNLSTAANRDDFIKMAMSLFAINLKRVFAVMALSKRLLEWVNFKILPEGQVKPLADRVEKLIQIRRAGDRKHDDYLALLIEARAGDQLELGEMDIKENHHAGLTQESLIQDQQRASAGLDHQSAGGRSMTDEEILSNATFLLVVGLETTASLLAFCTYTLAFHQEIQERLYQEVRAIGERDEASGKLTFDYDTLTSCQYLDSVLSETLRKFPAALMTDRVANDDYLIEKYSVQIEKDSKVILDLYSTMNDPDYWLEPEKFDPERFMPGNRDMIVPGSYCPFGLGPRHCIGMRFSLTEAKLALAKMVMNYSFEPAPGTKFPPEPKINIGLNGMKNPVVNLKLRPK